MPLLGGGTDKELADALNVSAPTIKKLWLSIHRRIANSIPELVPVRIDFEPEHASRGKEKKRRILAYLREHPEELRPVSRKLLRKI